MSACSYAANSAGTGKLGTTFEGDQLCNRASLLWLLCHRCSSMITSFVTRDRHLARVRNKAWRQFLARQNTPAKIRFNVFVLSTQGENNPLAQKWSLKIGSAAYPPDKGFTSSRHQEVAAAAERLQKATVALLHTVVLRKELLQPATLAVDSPVD